MKTSNLTEEALKKFTELYWHQYSSTEDPNNIIRYMVNCMNLCFNTTIKTLHEKKREVISSLELLEVLVRFLLFIRFNFMEKECGVNKNQLDYFFEDLIANVKENCIERKDV
jgi:hypothetical protein